MSVNYPIPDLLETVPFSAEGYSFRLVYRQEQSRQANGVTIVKDLGTPLWFMDATTGPLVSDDALDFEARLEALDGGLGSFLGWDMRRQFPRSRPTGSFADTATIGSIGANRKSMNLVSLQAGLVISRGDYLSFNSPGWASLHQVMETVTVSSAGATPVFEVRPHFWPGAAAGAAVKLKKASTIMALVPGSVEKQQVDAIHTAISFQAYQRP
jgi:hypothetical protein